MSGNFLRLYDPSVMHTRVLLVTVSVSHFVSVGLTNHFHIHVLPQLWRNSVNDCSSGASGQWIDVPVMLIHSASSSDFVTLAGIPLGNLYSQYAIRPSVLVGR